MKIYVMYDGDEVLCFDNPSPPRVGELIRKGLEEFQVMEVAWDFCEGPVRIVLDVAALR